MLCLSLVTRAEPVPAVPAPPTAPSGPPATAQAGRPLDAGALPLRVRLDRNAIRAAIATLPQESDPYPRRHEADTISATPTESFVKDFAAARLPDCLHSEGLRNQPTFFLGGVLALPFIAVAKLRGVCR